MIEFDLTDLIATAKELGRLREVYENEGDKSLSPENQKLIERLLRKMLIYLKNYHCECVRFRPLELQKIWIENAAIYPLCLTTYHKE